MGRGAKKLSWCHNHSSMQYWAINFKDLSTIFFVFFQLFSDLSRLWLGRWLTNTSDGLGASWSTPRTSENSKECLRQRNIETASTWLQPSSSAAQLKGYFFKRIDTRVDHFLSPVSQRNKKLRRNLGTKIFEGLFRLEAVDTFFHLLLEKSKSFFMQLSFFSLFEGKKENVGFYWARSSSG